MAYTPLQWVVGEQNYYDKFKTLSDNDAFIRQELLKHPLGILAKDTFIGANVTENAGTFTTFMTLPNVIISAGRWIKVSFTGNYQTTANNNYIALRVTMGGSQVISCGLPANLDAGNSTAAAARVIQPAAGTYTFNLDVHTVITNPQAAVIKSALSGKSPWVFVVEDIGGMNI